MRVLSAEGYIGELEAASAAMLKMEPHPPRHLGAVLQPLTTPVRVTRSDGASKVCNGDEWADIISNQSLAPSSAVASRSVVESARAQVETSLDEVRAWNTPSGGKFYQAAGAGKIALALAASGQIRTGPDWLQQILNRCLKAISDAWYAFAKWLQSLFPSRLPGAPKVNLSWVPAMLWTLLIGLLACLVAMLWVSLGGRWDRVRRRRAEGLATDGADAELMLLPPDELHRRALDFAAQGNFREALRHRYLSLLLVLDTCGVWRYDTRRTNWEHIGKLRSQPNRAPLLAPLADLTRRFDRVRYGGAACAAEDWDRFYQDTGRVETSAGAPPRAVVTPAAAGSREVTV